MTYFDTRPAYVNCDVRTMLDAPHATPRRRLPLGHPRAGLRATAWLQETHIDRSRPTSRTQEPEALGPRQCLVTAAAAVTTEGHVINGAAVNLSRDSCTRYFVTYFRSHW